MEPAPKLRPNRPDISESLEFIIQKALEKDCRHRFETMAVLGESLRETLARIAATDARFVQTFSRELAAFGTFFRSMLSRSAKLNPEKLIDPSRTPTGNLKATEWAHHGRFFLRRYDRPGNVDMAIATFQKAVERDPKFAPAFAGLAEAYYRKNSLTPDLQWSRLAMESSRKGVELDSDLALAHIARGIVFIQSPKDGDAYPELDRALELDPRSSAAHMWMAEYLARKGDPDQAEQHYKLAVELKNDDWNPHLYYGAFFFRRANYERAASEWEEARKLCEDNAMILSRLGAVHQKLGQYDDAAGYYQRTIEVQPSETAYNNLATLRFQQGNYERAVAAFEKTVELNPTSQLYWGNLGDARRWSPGQKGKANDAYRHAIHLAEAALSSRPDDPQLLGYLAQYAAKMGDSKRALEYVHRLEAISQRTPDSYFKTCVVYELTGHRSKALRDLRTAFANKYPLKDIQSEPELVALRADRAYHQMFSSVQSPGRD